MGEATLTAAEREWLAGQKIGRLATVGPNGWPHVMPVMYVLHDDGSFEFDADGVKLRNLEAQPRGALVIDGMGPRRGVAVQGECQVVGPERVRLHPLTKFSWGF